MKLFKPRFTVRWLMVAVAVAAVVCEATRRHYEYLRLVDWHASHAWNGGARAGTLTGGLSWTSVKGEHFWGFERKTPSPLKNKWHLQMMEKYKWAARYPWLPVTPDPPEPE